MRLDKIKLAGFKSFVDPTTIPFPKDLTGIVGPNGCGKSNTIDAVRWVMGESSAKTLRGEAMADVIFNGSTSRKPVGQASVELVFDNGDGRAGGQYAQYAEISVKRQVSRDGQSSYYLNGSRCRRKDIQDLFLGTGLGPRSYAIIEQGMISRFVEARPEDLRNFMEEAAGISKYKERRKETETRIRHTRENLDRLNDLREEVSKQLARLQRQSRTAQRYQEFKAEEREVKAEYLVLGWRDLDRESRERSVGLQALETRIEAARAQLRSVEAELEKQRDAHHDANDALNKVQADFYGVGSEIARLEQSIQHIRERRESAQQDLQQLEHDRAEALQDLEADRERLEELDQDLAEHSPGLQGVREAEAEVAEKLRLAEHAYTEWQTRWEDFNRNAAEPSQIAQVERTRINHLEEQAGRLSHRLERNRQELERLGVSGPDEELQALALQAEEQEAAREERMESLETLRLAITERRDELKRLGAEQSELDGRRRQIDGRRVSLEALQEAALGKDDGRLGRWLEGQGLDGAQRLAETLNVEPGWEKAVETVLGDYLEAVCVKGLETVHEAVTALSDVALTLFDSTSTLAPAAEGTLAAKVRAPWSLASLLGSVQVVEDPQSALARRGTLSPGESVICPQGVWYGPDWARIAGGEAQGSGGVLAREQELRELDRQQAALEPQSEELARRQQEAETALAGAESERESMQREVDLIAREITDTRTRLSARRARAEQLSGRRGQLQEEAAEIQQQVEEGQETILTSRARLHEALAAMEMLAEQRDELAQQRDQLRSAVDEQRSKVRSQRDAAHQLALKVERLRSDRDATLKALQRIEALIEQYRVREQDLRLSLEQAAEPIADLSAELEEKLAARLQVESELVLARNRVESLDAGLRESEKGRSAAEKEIESLREQLESLRLAQQKTITLRQTMENQLEETGANRDQVLARLPENADRGEWEASLAALEEKINRLGPINLAAIEEYQTQSERMAYLDEQHGDLTESLDTLEQAIQKIDRETRTRFRETFDKVNNGFQSMFPRLFGGGHAFLELTGNDLLDTGIQVMARPPGKRNSTIHLLSGGEKALTAVALVFSIFELNPAPFCMLDEVDAPLDEANVGRFCRLVREMSERVQFIIITHNKNTMEMTQHLSGVTMQEPGVSRLVSVDLEEAAQLAAM